MRLRLITTFAPAVLVLSAIAASPAQADAADVTGGRVSVPSVVTTTARCTKVPVSWDLSALEADVSWKLALTSDVGGSIAAGGTGPGKGSDTVQWCQADKPGTFHVTGTLQVNDVNQEPVAADDISLTFTTRRMTTKATIRIGDGTPKVEQGTNVRGCVTVGAKRRAGRAVVVEYRWIKSKKWSRIATAATGPTGCYTQAVAATGTGTYLIRVRVPGDSISKTGLSKVIRIKVHA
ncbi:hypothetical protein [Kineosporia sp. NBRC 101731]|uniref:hypothetical protein n=1 Tax=Kineosporia sp. NBRC 101731 TaxID=3032199 RepID=UPI0024A4CE9E|nr:hypothetical protein [Kineosporia sp. NBRC 101731]GLY28815.1 hypothetical protein Kisp02_21800 [Kineosporia sp. NBRC 101731]